MFMAHHNNALAITHHEFKIKQIVGIWCFGGKKTLKQR
jgi:hypothetical protein